MRVLIRRESLKRTLQWSQRLFFAAAILLLGYSGFVVLDSWVFEQRESRILQRLLDNRYKPGTYSSQFQPAKSAAAPPATGTSGLIGRLEIPRLGLSVIVIEGTTPAKLRRAAGHIPGTALPGQPGNVGISAHRDTYFRPLRNIRQDDIITLTALMGEYHYRVVSIRIVGPDNVSVLDSSDNQILTLVTCYPFYFVGSAPDRFIIRAERIT
jgi:sortase A